MIREELNNLIEEWENAKVDFKRQWYWNENMPNNIKEVHKNELVKDLIALTNGDVYSIDKIAYLIVGIDDETRELYDFDKSAILPLDKLKQQLLTFLNNYAQPEFLALDIELVDEVLVISIPPRGSLISLSKDLKLKNNNTDKKGTTYYRIGEDIRVASSEVVGEFEKAFGNTRTKDSTLCQTTNLTKVELESQRKKEKSSLFSSIKESDKMYIERNIDAIVSNEISQKKSSILFIQAQGGSGKSTLLKKFSQTDRPTIFIHLNDKIDISAIDLFLDDAKTTVSNCPKFDAKLDEIFLKKENNTKDSFGEYELLEALREDFFEHGVFIVDTFEKNKNSQIKSRVDFQDKIKSSRTDRFYRFRDYLEKLVYYFLPKTTFIIAGRNRISDIKEDSVQEKFLDLDEVREITIESFSTLDIEEYIQKSELERPTDKQLAQIKELTNGNALLVYLLIKVAHDYESWNKFDYDEMKKVLLEDKDFGLIYYFTKRILTHIEIENIWKLLIPRELSIEIENILFKEKGVFDSLVDVGLAYKGKGKERYLYTLHDDVYNAIEAYARKELRQDNLSWQDNVNVQNIHQQLKEFYELNQTNSIDSNFDVYYHNMMMKDKFEFNFNRERKAFIQSYLGRIFITYREKISFCKQFNTLDSNTIEQTILDTEEEIKKSLPRMSIELYQECSAYASKGVSEEGIYIIEFLEPLLIKYEKKQDLFQIYSFLGQTYQNKKEYEKARKTYIEAIAKDLDDEDFFYLLIGNTYYFEEKDEKALEYYQLASRINKKNDVIFNNMGSTYWRMRKYDKAFESYKKSIEIKPTESNYINIAMMFYEEKKYNRAIELYHKAITLNPYNEWAYINMANCYRDKRPPNYQEAFDIYWEAISINPKNENIYNNLGILFFRKKRYEDAISFYHEAIEKNPKNEWFYRNIGEAYKLLKNTDKSMEYFDKAIEINPNESSFYNDIGLAFFLKKSYIKAVSFFKKSIEIDSNDFIFYNDLGDAYEKMMEYNSAIHCYEKSLKLQKNFNAQFNGARIYMKQKKYEASIKVYQQLISSYPREKILIYRELYKCYFYNKDYVLMAEIIKELFMEKQNMRNKIRYQQRKRNEEKIMEWKNNINISEENIYMILIATIGSGWIGLFYIIYRYLV